jgi:hypothetical protein
MLPTRSGSRRSQRRWQTEVRVRFGLGQPRGALPASAPAGSRPSARVASRFTATRTRLVPVFGPQSQRADAESTAFEHVLGRDGGPLPSWARVLGMGLIGLLTIGLQLGCTAPFYRSSHSDVTKVEPVVEPEESESGLRTIGDHARPYGLTWQVVEGVALATQLKGTGSDPPPSPLRDELRREMQSHDVSKVNDILASKDTSLVTVRGVIPPGAQQGDVFDVMVMVPPRMQTSSLRGGFLMRSRLRQHAVIDKGLREGHVAALAQGNILVDGIFSPNEKQVGELRGRVLSGGVVQKARPIGLYIAKEDASVRVSAMIGRAINNRFHHYDRGSRKGVANPTRDDTIELVVHPRYKHNLSRYFRVISEIAYIESDADRARRVELLERILLEPTSAETAALQLEAIGEESAPTLRKGVRSDDPEVRFYAAETLAYLDDADAVPALYEAARSERAFRWRALTALATMNSFQAQEHLAMLANEPSAETRYGAFRALWMRNPRDPLIRGELMGEHEFSFHVVSTKSQPMIHFSRSRRPEMVVFGQDLRLQTPEFLFAGKEILIQQADAETVRLTRYQPGKPETQEVCSNKLDDVVRTIVKLGGGYSEVFEAVKHAKHNGTLPVRVEVDALPVPGRERRLREERENELEPNGPDDGKSMLAEDSTTSDDPSEKPSRFRVANPVPDMFVDRLNDSRLQRDPELSGELEELLGEGASLPDDPSSGGSSDDDESSESGRTNKSFWGNMKGWFSWNE